MRPSRASAPRGESRVLALRRGCDPCALSSPGRAARDASGAGGYRTPLPESQPSKLEADKKALENQLGKLEEQVVDRLALGRCS